MTAGAMRWQWWGCAAITALVLGSCAAPGGVFEGQFGEEDSGQTGDTGASTTDPGECVLLSTRSLDTTEVTDLGFSADEVIQRLDQDWTATLTWDADGLSEEIALGAIYVEGSAEWLTYSGQISEGEPCPGVIRVEVDASLATTGSDLLDELGRAQIETSTLSEVSASWTVDEHDGALVLDGTGLVTSSFSASTTHGFFKVEDADGTTLLASW